MAIQYVLDEHMRGRLFRSIQSHNAGGINPIDVVQVGDPPDLPLGTPDPDLLLWAEQHGRILITRDVNMLPAHLADHLRAGHHSPGIFVIRDKSKVADIIVTLVLIAHAGDPAMYAHAIVGAGLPDGRAAKRHAELLDRAGEGPKNIRCGGSLSDAGPCTDGYSTLQLNQMLLVVPDFERQPIDRPVLIHEASLRLT
jgi:hypothetical protein